MTDSKEKEIDLIEIIQKLWSRKWFIVKWGAIGMALGLVVVVFSPREYKSSTLFVPQTSGLSLEGNMGSLGGLAAMAGVNIGNLGGSNQSISPKLYPKILTSATFRKELMYSWINTEKSADSVTVYDYLTRKEFRNFSLSKLLMPSELKTKPSNLTELGEKYDIDVLTLQEQNVAKMMGDALKMAQDSKTNYITVSGTMSDALAAAEFTRRAVELLQRYVIDIKIETAANKLEFIEARYEEVKADYYDKLAAMSRYADSHRGVTSAVGMMQGEKLQNDYKMAYSIYGELASQLEKAKLEVKQDTPTFTVIDPVVIPARKSAPKTTVLGLVFGFVAAFGAAAVIIIRELTFSRK